MGFLADAGAETARQDNRFHGCFEFKNGLVGIIENIKDGLPTLAAICEESKPEAESQPGGGNAKEKQATAASKAQKHHLEIISPTIQSYLRRERRLPRTR
jgi:hypothetical protein